MRRLKLTGDEITSIIFVIGLMTAIVIEALQGR